MNTRQNLILSTDSYKLSHWKQYPPESLFGYAYMDSRPGSTYPFTVFFGLRYILKMLEQGITFSDILEAETLCGEHMGSKELLNIAGWERILDEYGGAIPIIIKALPEGTLVPTGVPMFTIETPLEAKMPWLVTYFETLLEHVWYPSSVATISYNVRKAINAAMMVTDGHTNGAEFKLHDFGYRGVSSVESAGIGGSAHLLSFLGTDTLEAILAIRRTYGDSAMPGFSIPASEHSTITSWGRGGEVDGYDNMLTVFPTGLVACVSDSFDLDHAVNYLWGYVLREKVLAREGTLVVRPDSGEIVSTVLRTLQNLWDRFGGEVNALGFKVLNPKVRVIQGDGCTPETIQKVLDAMIAEKWSIQNVAFGMGGGLLQKVNRDTQKIAIKMSEISIRLSAAQVEEGGYVDVIFNRPVYKDPVGDKTKISKFGRFSVVQGEEGLECIPQSELGDREDLLKPVFDSGLILDHDSFATIRQRVVESL